VTPPPLAVTRGPLAGLAVALAASAALLLVLGSNLTFFREDWELLISRQDWTTDSFLRPFLEHIVLAPTGIYKLLVAIFGIESALPFRVVSTAAFSLSVVLLFLWLRRRVGGWPALLGAVAIAFLGAAYEDLLWPFQIGYFGSVAAGLGMLLALDRDDRRGDALAGVLLVVSLSFSSLGIAFAAGAGADVLLGRRPRARRLPLVLVPLVLFALWWAVWGQQADSALSAANLFEAPRYVFEAIGAGLASLLGLASSDPEAERTRQIAGHLLALAALTAALLRIWHLGRVPRDVAVALAIALTFWVLAAMNQTFDRPPDASRYQYPSAVFLLLICGGLLRGVRIGGRPLIVAAAVTSVAVVSGTALLHREYERWWLPASDSLRASLAGLEIAGEGAGRDFTVNFPPNITLPASSYFELIRTAGSPAFSESELAGSGERVRVAADLMLAGAHELRLTPDARRAKGLDGCRRLADGGALELPRRTLTLVATGDGPVEVLLSRFSPTPSVTLGEIRPATSARLSIPLDLSVRRWRLHLRGEGSLAVCRFASRLVAAAPAAGSKASPR
jgi:hypothetical protein